MKTTPTTKLPPLGSPLSPNEYERHRQDETQLRNDLKLLSGLLGRQILIQDIPSLTRQIATMRTTKPTTTQRPTTTTTTTMKPNMSDEELAKFLKERAEIQKNLKLLSSLLGRDVSIEELPSIMQQLRGGRKSNDGKTSTIPRTKTTPTTTTTTATTTTTTSTPPIAISSLEDLKTTKRPLTQNEILELLKNPVIGGGMAAEVDLYGKTNEAVLAAILKQRGIGPAHNNIPVNVSLKEQK